MEIVAFNSIDARKNKTKLKRRYWIIMGGLILLYGGYTSFLNLQSSIRVQDGLGVKLTAITYSITTLFSVFIAPAALRLCGPKKSLILSEFGYVVYVLANFFSNEGFLYAGAIAASISESIVWIPIGISFVYFAKKYHHYSEKSEDACIMLFSGYFLGMFHTCQIYGNLIIILVLNTLTFSPSINDTTIATTTNTTNSFNEDFDFFSTTINNMQIISNSSVQDHLIFCGSNDCQEQTIVEDSIEQYVPQNPIAIYVITGCFIVFMLLGIFIHAMLVPEMPFSSFNSQSAEQSKTEEALDMVTESETHSKSTVDFRSILQTSFKASKDLLLQFFHPHQIFFVTPYAIYLGLINSFILVESTRAFASCVLGVEQIGYCLIVYACANSIQSLMLGKFFGKKGRVPLLLFGVVFDLSLFVFCLSWQPTEDTSWLVYLIFALLGISYATAGMVVATLFGSAGYKTKETSFNIWMITFSIGFTLQNAFSTLLCVKTKLYIMMVWVTLSSLMAGIHERRQMIKSLLDVN